MPDFYDLDEDFPFLLSQYEKEYPDSNYRDDYYTLNIILWEIRINNLEGKIGQLMESRQKILKGHKFSSGEERSACFSSLTPKQREYYIKVNKKNTAKVIEKMTDSVDEIVHNEKLKEMQRKKRRRKKEANKNKFIRKEE